MVVFIVLFVIGLMALLIGRERYLHLRLQIETDQLVLFRSLPFTRPIIVSKNLIKELYLTTLQGFASGTQISLLDGKVFNVQSRKREDHRKIIEFSKVHNINCLSEETWHGGEVQIINKKQNEKSNSMEKDQKF